MSDITVKYYAYLGKNGRRLFKHVRDNRLLIDTVVQICVDPGNRKRGRPRQSGITFVSIGYLKNYINDKDTLKTTQVLFVQVFDKMCERLKSEEIK